MRSNRSLVAKIAPILVATGKPLVRGLLPAFAVLLIGPAVAQASLATGSPQFFNNNVKIAENMSFTEGPPAASLLDIHGEMLFTSPKETSEVECVDVSWGQAWNAFLMNPLEMSRGHGLIQGWWASGHIPGIHATVPPVSSKCYSKQRETVGMEAWVSAERVSEESASMNPLKKNLSTPWRFEALCGEREASPETTIIKIGIPFPDPEYPDRCETEAEELKEIKEEIEGVTIEGRVPCYNKETTAVLQAPPGCIKVNIVVPGLGLESHYEGTLRAVMLNGVKNGLSPSRWEFRGEPEGELHLLGSAPGFAGVLDFVTSTLKNVPQHPIGFGASELFTAK
jgi:hypothetical protein